ncbi:MAG TPA: hypothetical protein DCL77_14525 [Prolixibacteraceae bacterium]|jgi:hypothetical protein|nr:hypothetical protein [Prolixibacteraceae bacterium]
MGRISLTPNLFLDEYIPKAMYLKYEKTPWILIGMLDRRLIKADQLLRDKFGSVTINNWWNDGERQWSGIRTEESPDYSLTSQHTFARASDKLFSLATEEEVREYIKVHWRELGITCIEKGVSWVHSDVRWWQGDSLLIV